MVYKFKYAIEKQKVSQNKLFSLNQSKSVIVRSKFNLPFPSLRAHAAKVKWTELTEATIDL